MSKHLRKHRRGTVGRRATAAAVSVLTITFAAACSSGGGTSSTGGASNSSNGNQAVVAKAKNYIAPYLKPATAIGVTTPLSGPAVRGKTIVIPLASDEASQTVAKAIKEAASVVGWTVKTFPFSLTSPQSLITGMQQTLQMRPKPAAIAISAIPEAVWGNMEPEFEKAGIAILVTAISGVPVSAAVPTGGHIFGDETQKLRGRLLGDFMIMDSGGRANAVAIGSPDLPSFTSLNEGIQEAFAGCPDCKLTIANGPITDLESDGTNFATSAVQRYPSATYLAIPYGQFFPGLTNALDTAGDKAVKIVGASSDPEDLQEVKAGTAAAFLSTALTYVGYEVMDAALRVAGHEKLPVDEYDAMPQQIFTKDTITSSDINSDGNDYLYPADFQEQFYKLWGVTGS
jgi:ABC-type sugar transport system substrate-binding protein